MQSLILKKNEEHRIRGGHLWIYSNEIDAKLSPLKNFQPGEIVKINTANNHGLGYGYINPHNLLCVRLLTTNLQEKIDIDFFITKIKTALLRRQCCFAQPFYRLIFGESDGLPGLVVDRFATTLVAQLNTAGMENLKTTIIAALIHTIQPTAILFRNTSSSRTAENLPSYVEAAYGAPPEQVMLEENGINFLAAIKTGQKTGWFYDQRYNRARLAAYVKDKRILDVFSYSGSFGIVAAKHHAKAITCIDTSAPALEQLQQNAELNKVTNIITTICQDASLALKDLHNTNKKFDVIILDPPAFIKRQKDFASGVAAYLRLHRLALNLLATNGILLTTSCSLHLSRDSLLEIVRQALHKEQRLGTIIEQLHQAPDHPIHPAIMETNYLKGFIVHIL